MLRHQEPLKICSYVLMSKEKCAFYVLVSKEKVSYAHVSENMLA